MNSLFIDQNLADLWPGFLPLVDRTGGGPGRGGEKYSFAVYRDLEIQFYSYQEGEIQCRNTIYYSLFSFEKFQKSILATP